MDNIIINDTIYEQILNGSIDFLGFQVYEADELLYDVPIGIIVLLSIFYGSISIIAIVGNSLVIWIVGTARQMQTVTNLFIANLALADVIIGMFAIPFQFQAALLQRWNLPDFMCPFCPFVQILTVNVSVLTLTAIAIDRHRAIINPLKARPSKKTLKLILGLIWLISITFAVPIVIALQVDNIPEMIMQDEIRKISFRPFCQIVNLNPIEMEIYRYLLVFIQYVIPFCIISFVYIQMAIRLWGSKTPGNAQDTRDINLLKNKKRVIKMLVIVVILFGICWLPLQTYNILHVTWPSINHYRYVNIIWFCSDWLAMSNSCYNPFIYGIYNEKFKREFHKRFPLHRLGFDKRSDFGEKTMSIHTRVSSIRSNYTTSSTRNTQINDLNNINDDFVRADSNRPSASDQLTNNYHVTRKSWTNKNTPNSTSASNWNKKKNCGCLPKVLYRQVNISPRTNRKVLYQPIDTGQMTINKHKCCCQQKESCYNYDLNYNNGIYHLVPLKKHSPNYRTSPNKKTINKFNEIETDLYLSAGSGSGNGSGNGINQTQETKYNNDSIDL